MSSAGGGGCGSGSAGGGVSTCWPPTCTKAPPGSSMPKTFAATRSRSIQWNDWANVAYRNGPRLGGISSARSRSQRAFVTSRAAAARLASSIMPRSASTPTTSANRLASRSATVPGPQPTSIRRGDPCRSAAAAKASRSPGRVGNAAAVIERGAAGEQALIPDPALGHPSSFAVGSNVPSDNSHAAAVHPGPVPIVGLPDDPDRRGADGGFDGSARRRLPRGVASRARAAAGPGEGTDPAARLAERRPPASADGLDRASSTSSRVPTARSACSTCSRAAVS